MILGRVSNLPTVWTNVVVGWLVGGGLFGPQIGWMIAGVSLLYWAGMTLNDAFDVDWDKAHAPERPIPKGDISVKATWIIGVVQMLAGAALIIGKTDASLAVLAGLIAAILAYDWIHKKWKGAVLIMGLCRALVYLLGWTAARSDMQLAAASPLVYLLGIGVLLYIAGLTLVARGERDEKSNGLAALPRVLLLIPSAFPVMVLYCEQSLDITHALLFGGIIISSAWIIFVRTLLSAGKIPQGIGFAIAGIALYDAVVAFYIDWRAGVFCLVCFGLALVAQRVIPAT